MKTLEEISFFPDLEDESNISMSLYTQRLAESIKKMSPKLKINLYKPIAFKCPDIISHVVDRIPYLRFYNKELFLSRNIIYPLMARRYQAQINHIISHNNANLVSIFEPSKTIVTCHDLQPIVAYAGSSVKPKWLKWFERRVQGMQKAARVIAISQNTKRDILKYTNVHEENIEVIYNAVDKSFKPIRDSKVLEDTKKKYGLYKISGNMLLNVGSNQRRKNIEGILHTLKIVRNKGYDVALAHVGQMLNSQQVQVVHDLGLSGKVHDLGHVSTDDLVFLYNLSDMLIFPSFYEGFGWPIVEAFACGTPVITSNTSSMPEIAGDASLIVDPSNPKDISNAIMRILTDKDLRENLTSKGLKRAKYFRWETHAEQVLNVYEEVLLGDV